MPQKNFSTVKTVAQKTENAKGLQNFFKAQVL
jgi:hypothetical protein